MQWNIANNTILNHFSNWEINKTYLEILNPRQKREGQHGVSIEPDLWYALLATTSQEEYHTFFSCHIECFIYEAREQHVHCRC